MASRRPGPKPACAALTTPRKRRRASTCSAPAPAPAPASPIVVLEIVARSDVSTLVRCAALCKSLRRRILSPAFLRRVTCRADRIVPPCLLGYLHTYDDEEAQPSALFSLVHPSTVPAAVSFSDKHLTPFLSGSAAYCLLGRYRPVTSRGGLVVLRRRSINRRKRSERRSDMCVYDPMTGKRTFFSDPPDIGKGHYYPQPISEMYVLLTAADGIGCSFILFVGDFSGFHDSCRTIRAQTMSSDSGGTWAPITYKNDLVSPWWSLDQDRDAVVLRGGVICWLGNRDHVLTYEVSTSKPGSVKLPVTDSRVSQLHLGKSPEGRLRLLVADGFLVSVWLLLSSGNAWELSTVMDMEDQLRLLDPEIPPGPVFLKFRSSGERSGAALLRVASRFRRDPDGPLIVLDVETGNMRASLRPTLVLTRYVLSSTDPPGDPFRVAAISDGFDAGGIASCPDTAEYLRRMEAAGSDTLARLLLADDVRVLVYDSHLPWARRVARDAGVAAAAFMTQMCAMDVIYGEARAGRVALPLADGSALRRRGVLSVDLGPEDVPPFVAKPEWPRPRS
ncbi:hypothetical protein ACQ4PT_028261 [Festuca glaucescens]